MICQNSSKQRCVWEVILVLSIYAYEGYSLLNQCQSMESLKEKTNQLRNASVIVQCDVPRTCTDIECLARNGVFYSHIEYGLSFETFCSSTSTFIFYWSVGGANITKKLYNIDSSRDEIDISYWNPKTPSRTSVDGSDKIVIEKSLKGSGKDYIVLFVHVSLKMNSTLTIDLIPSHNLTFNLCSYDQYTVDADSKQYTTPVMPEETIIRTSINRTCNPNEMGNCRDNEVCRRKRSEINNETQFFCFCLDGFVIDAKEVCVVQQTNKPTNYNVIFGIVGGIVVTVIIVIVFVIIIKKHQRRSRRYNEFDLTTHDPTLPDPPMLEA